MKILNYTVIGMWCEDDITDKDVKKIFKQFKKEIKDEIIFFKTWISRREGIYITTEPYLFLNIYGVDDWSCSVAHKTYRYTINPNSKSKSTKYIGNPLCQYI